MKMYSKQYKTLNGAQQFVKLLKQKEKNDIQIWDFHYLPMLKYISLFGLNKSHDL